MTSTQAHRPPSWPIIGAGVALALLGGAAAALWLVSPGPVAAEMAVHICAMSFLGPMAAFCLHVVGTRRFVRSDWLWLVTISQIGLLWAIHIPQVHHTLMLWPLLRMITLVSLFAVATCFWSCLLARRASPPWQEILALLITAKLACLLAVLLVFAPRDIYRGAHAAVDAIADQQMAGLLMLVACPLTYLVPAIVLAAQLAASSASEYQPLRSTDVPVSPA
jgi:putative membrane protein